MSTNPFRSAAAALGRSVDSAVRSSLAAKAVSKAETKLATSRRERKIGKGTLRSTHVEAYRGYVAGGHAHVRVRVIEEPVIPDAAEQVTDTKLVRSNLRRFVPIALPGVRLNFMATGTRPVRAVSDRHGYATARIPVTDLEEGWYPYHCVTEPDDPTENPTIASSDFLVAPGPRTIVVSDIDDTVLRTGLTEGMTAVRNTLLGTAVTRRSVPGMAAFYRLLANRLAGDGIVHFCYVSTGPWNLYDMLTTFLDFRGFPKGVLFLTDWGPQDRYIMRSGIEHKRTTLRKLVEAFPEAQLLCVGDSGQNDPTVYVEIAREYPGRVRDIVIVDVGEHKQDRATELLAWSEELSQENVPLTFVTDAVAAARVYAERGIFHPEDAGVVAAQYESES